MKINRLFPLAVMLFSLVLGTVSCSEEDNTIEEYPDWQATNDAFFDRLSDSVKALLAADPARTDWKRIKSWSKSDVHEGANSDYIIVHVEQSAPASETAMPLYTDTVTVSYTGRLLPSLSYPAGFIFDRTFYGDYNPELSSCAKFAVGNSYGNNLVDGFATALQQMRRGDRWTVYIPYQLGYRGTANGDVPAYSTLIFDLVLRDFWGPVYP